jgi:hypothetical protein
MPDRFARGITRTVSCSASADCSGIRCDPFAPRTGFRTPEKRRSGVSSGGTPRGGPHPHALSLACATFFVIVTARSTRFAPQTGHIEVSQPARVLRGTTNNGFRVFLSDNGKTPSPEGSCVAAVAKLCGGARARIRPREKAVGIREQGSPPLLWPRGGARVMRPAAAIAARTGHRNPDSRQRQRNCRKDQGGPL